MKPVQQLVAAALLVLAGSVGAAQVDILGTYQVQGGSSFDITTTASDRDAAGNPNGKAYEPNYFYELVVNAYEALATFMLGSTHNETVPVRYFLWQDQNTALGQGQITKVGLPGSGLADGALAETVPYLTVGQSFQYSLPPGQYILQIQKNSKGWESITTNVSAIPLPGALWMFGAALVGFVGFSNRRKV